MNILLKWQRGKCCISGSLIIFYQCPIYSSRLGMEKATNLGCAIEGHDTLKCLQEAPLSSLLLSKQVQPAVDAPYTSTPFLPMSSYEAFTTGKYNKDVDIMLGVNKDEGVLLVFPAHIAPSLVEVFNLLTIKFQRFDYS